MSRRITVRGIIYKDGKIFAVKHKDHAGSAKEFWCTPGGGLDDGEALEDGIRRELKEETGVDAQVGRLLFIQQFSKTPDASHGFDEFLEFFFQITNPDDFEMIDLTSTTHGDAEISAYDFVDPTAVIFLPTCIANIDFKRYVETIQPPYIYTDLK